jgi:uncharacterized repeat protein (TIGR01451 family)
MRGRRFAAVAGWVAVVVAVPALVVLLAAGSLSGQPGGPPIYEHGAYDPVGFGLSGARVQLLRVALHEGAQVWVYEVTNGTPDIDFWQLGVCLDIKQADILEATEDFDLKPLPIDPNYQTIKFPDDYPRPNEVGTVAFALADRWPIVRQPARMKLYGGETQIRNLESPGCPRGSTPPTTGPGTPTEPQAPTTGGSGAAPVVSDTVVAEMLRDPTALSVAKLGSPPRARAGGSASYRIEVRNRSKGTAQQLVVTDTPPKGATAHSASAKTTSAGNLVWRRASLAPGQRWTLNVRMDVPAGARGEIVNRVRVASANAVTVESQAPTRVVRSTVVPVTG